ncbi:hypothetical protein BJX70DRAFT_78710 [Aspergillus crustosus]
MELCWSVFHPRRFSLISPHVVSLVPVLVLCPLSPVRTGLGISSAMNEYLLQSACKGYTRSTVLLKSDG